jgi:hypothetical protein
MEKPFPQVFILSGAASITGNLTLDGGEIQIQFLLKQMELYGAANTTVILTSGAQARNVFWLAYGVRLFSKFTMECNSSHNGSYYLMQEEILKEGF